MENPNIFPYDLLNGTYTIAFFARFVFDIIVIYVIARIIYFRLTQKRDYLFTLTIINILVFFVCYLMSSAKLSLSFAFGIFALFSIIRYRTRQVPIKEMTYLFISICIAIINALSYERITFLELIFTNLAIVLFTFLLEKTWVRNELRKSILYERIELIKPEKYEELLGDLQERTGLTINRVEVGSIDFLKDTARLRVYYYETPPEKN